MFTVYVIDITSSSSDDVYHSLNEVNQALFTWSLSGVYIFLGGEQKYELLVGSGENIMIY